MLSKEKNVPPQEAQSGVHAGLVLREAQSWGERYRAQSKSCIKGKTINKKSVAETQSRKRGERKGEVNHVQ